MLFSRGRDKLAGLPPCGGSGLKYHADNPEKAQYSSPSVWREWIEIAYQLPDGDKLYVSLRVEGVD